MNLLKFFSHFSIPLTVSSLLLLILGIAVIATLAPNNLPVQLISAFIAVFIYAIITITRYQTWYQISPWLYICGLVVLAATLVISSYTRGARSWLVIGPLSLQPSEIVRPLCILFIARFASETNRPTFKHILLQLAYAAPALLIILLQPDLGSAILLSIGLVGIFIAQRLQVKYWLIGILVVAISLPIFWAGMQDYQRQRIFTFLSPTSDPSGAGYNVIQSQLAIGSGQIVGKGLGRGTQSHLRFLPEYHTDFIFAAIAEELGLVGSTGIIILYAILYGVFVKAITDAREPFSHYVSAGMFLTLFGQTIINIGMNQGIMPVTGVTLPLLSYGGSSLISTMLMLGIIGSIRYSQRTKQSIEIR